MSLFSKIFWGEKKEKSIIANNSLWFNLSLSALLPTVTKNTAYEMYAINGDVRTCVRMKWLALSKQYFTLLDKKTMKQKLEKDSNVELYDIVNNLLSRPTYSHFLIEVVKHLDVSWEVYMAPTKSLEWEINWIQLLHPLTITKMGRKWEVVQFLQHSDSWSKTFLNQQLVTDSWKDTLLYFKLEPHVLNEYDGMWLLESVVWDVLTDKEALISNLAQFKNWLKPSHVLIPNDNLTKEQTDALKLQIEHKHQGSENNGKPLLAFGIKDVKSAQANMRDMEYTNQRRLTTEKVCSTLQVPQQLIWYQQGADYKLTTVYKNFVENTVNPYQDLIEYMINEFIQEYEIPLVSDYYVSFDDIKVEDENEQRKIDMDEVDRWLMTINQYVEKYWREPFPQEEADIPMVTSNRVRIDDVSLSPVLDTSNS